jgi:formyl-CoA transferase
MNLYLHSAKRTVASTDRTLIGELAAAADIVICEAATADELLQTGFDEWSTPIKVAITPFGRTGPKRNTPATPSTVLAIGGYTYLMGDPGRPPLSLPGHYLEFQAGALAYGAALAAHWAGQNTTIDIGMLETLMSCSQFTTVRWHCAGEIRTRHGSDFHFVVPSELFACVDGWVYVNIVPTFWDAFTVFIDRPELLVDDRFGNNDTRMQNRQALHAIIADALIDATVDELGQRAADCRVPVGVVHTFAAVLADEHLAVRRFWEELQVGERTLRSPGLAYRIDG